MYVDIVNAYSYQFSIMLTNFMPHLSHSCLNGCNIIVFKDSNLLILIKMKTYTHATTSCVLNIL